MMPDLGKYTEAVLSSYAVTIVLLVVLVVMSVHRGRKARRALEEVERRRGSDG